MTKQEVKKLKTGDLVHLPEDVDLFKMNEQEEEEGIPYMTKYIITSKPVIVPIIDFDNLRALNLPDGFTPRRRDTHCKVLYEGGLWSVAIKDIYVRGDGHDQTG
jgi:hypothetical protein